MGVSNLLKGDHFVEPFTPGTYEEYDITEDGFVKFNKKVEFHAPGQKPSFKTFVPWNGKKLNIWTILSDIFFNF